MSKYLNLAKKSRRILDTIEELQGDYFAKDDLLWLRLESLKSVAKEINFVTSVKARRYQQAIITRDDLRSYPKPIRR